MVNTAKIKGRLRELGKTQADLAAYTGTAQSTVNQKINGERPLSLVDAEQYALFLGISVSEFASYFLAGFLHSAEIKAVSGNPGEEAGMGRLAQGKENGGEKDDL